MITDARTITSQTQHITDTKNMSSQEIRLKANSVSITACELEHGVMPLFAQKAGDGHRARPHHRGGVIGHIDPMNSPT